MGWEHKPTFRFFWETGIAFLSNMRCSRGLRGHRPGVGISCERCVPHFIENRYIIGDNKMLRSCYYLHLVQALASIWDLRFEIWDLLHRWILELQLESKIAIFPRQESGAWNRFWAGWETSFLAAGQISKPRFFLKKTGWLNLIENAARYQLLPSERLNS